MAKCQFCDKGVSFGIKVSHSHRRSNRTWKPNVKRVKAIVDGKPQHVYACTRCLCNHCTEQGSPDWASLFRILGRLRRVSGGAPPISLCKGSCQSSG